MKHLILALAMTATTAQADLIVQFNDGAPKDRFTIVNAGACATSGWIAITLDLYPSPAGLFFDVTGAGAGVEVFQPFELTEGAELVTGVSAVTDGDQILTLQLSALEPAGQVGFTIDLDSTADASETTVSGSEIAGAIVMVTTADLATEAAFDVNGQARIPLSPCTS